MSSKQQALKSVLPTIVLFIVIALLYIFLDILYSFLNDISNTFEVNFYQLGGYIGSVGLILYIFFTSIEKLAKILFQTGLSLMLFIGLYPAGSFLIIILLFIKLMEIKLFKPENNDIFIKILSKGINIAFILFFITAAIVFHSYEDISDDNYRYNYKR